MSIVRPTSALILAVTLLFGSAESAWGEEPPPQEAPTGIEAITVTAEKREADLQDTALSIQAFSSRDLDRAGMHKSEDIGGFTPGFQMIPAVGSNSQVAFMGRGSVRTDNHPINEQSVGLYIDGMYHGTGEAALFELMDLERIELLKGPQGTLFGRNTIGGAVNIITKKPQPEFGGKIKLGFGQNRYFGVNASVDVPIIQERLLSRFSFMSRDRDAFTRNDADRRSYNTILEPGFDDNDDQDAWGVRAAIRFLATEDLTIDYSFDRLEHDQRTPAFAVSESSLGFLAAFKETDNGDISTEGANWDRETVWQNTINMEWTATQNLTVKSITGWRKYHGSRMSDLDGTTATFTGTQGIAHFRNKPWIRSFYQELQFVGTLFEERLDYSMGANWFQDESEILNRGEVFTPSANNLAEVKGDNYSWGIYSQFNFHATDRLDLTLGLRFSHERRETEHSLCRPAAGSVVQGEIDDCPASGLLPGRFTKDGTPGTGGPTSGVLGLSGAARFDNWSPLARISYNWTDELMTYLSWSRGYRAGGFQNRPPNGSDEAFVPYDEETISQWEAGIKSRWFDNRLQFNASGFYSEYEDEQVARLVPGAIITLTENAGKSRIRGWEFEARAVPIEGLEMRLAHGYTNTDFSEFNSGGQNIADQRCHCRQPKRTWSGWLSYTFPSTQFGTLQLLGNFRRNSWTMFNSVRRSANPGNRNMEQSSFTVYGAQAHLYDALGMEGLTLSVIGRNITDTVYAVNGVNFTVFQGLTYGDPRHWIVEASYEF